MREESGFILRRLLLIVLVCVIIAAILGVILPFPLFAFGLVLLIEGIILVLATKIYSEFGFHVLVVYIHWNRGFRQI
jgi:hypothetical protein